MDNRPAASVILAPASGPGVGGGHILRCLSLAHSLRQRSAECSFLVGADGADLIRRFSTDAQSVHHDAGEAIAGAASGPYVVVDDYVRSSELERQFRPHARGILAIDDLADRRHDADVILDSGYGRLAEDYAGLAPVGARLLVGPQYALLRPEFTQMRARAVSDVTRDQPARVFISFGLSDVGGIAARAARLVLAYNPSIRIDLAIASDAQSLSTVMSLSQSDSRLSIHLDTRNISELLVRCDLAIGAGGSSTWERMCLGRPSLAVAVADNQRPLLRALQADGLLHMLDLEDPAFESAFVDALHRLWPLTERRALAAKCAAICDGQGAERAAAALLAL